MCLRKPRYLFLSVILLFSRSLSAQYFDFSFDHYTSDQGLSNDIINSIVRDKTGFMWFGTNSGLNRFDGRTFHVIRSDKRDSTGLPSDHITSMSCDKDGWLWISTTKGLVKFSPDENKFVNVFFPGNDRKKNSNVSNVAFTRDDHVYFINNEGLFKMKRDGSGLKNFRLPTIESYSSVFIDKKDRIWVYLRNALYRFDESAQEFHYYGGMNNLNPTDTRIFGFPVETKSDTLFIANYGGGMHYFDEKLDAFIKWKRSSHLLVYAVEDTTLSGKRFFWCLGGTTGLMIYDPASDKFHPMMNNPRDPYTHNATDCSVLYKDPLDGTVWIGTKAGIEKYDRFSFRFKRKFLPPSIGYSSFALIGEVLKDRTDPTGDTYWAGSWAMGLLKWSRDDNEFRVFNMNQGLLSHEVFHVIQGRNGNLIIASRDGVTIFDPRTEKPVRTIKNFFDWPVSRKILHVEEDLKGDIWMVANYDGIYQYEIATGKVKKWDLPGVVPEKGPYLSGTVYADKNNRLWIAGFTDNIYVIDPVTGEVQTISNDTRVRKLPAPVKNLYIHRPSNNIWVSGAGNFLAQLDEKGEVIKLFEEPGAEDEQGYSIMLQDPLGFLWVNYETFIQRIDLETGKRDMFAKDDGLVSSSGIYGASITPDGELFLGFQYAFSHINTLNIPFNRKPPVVAVSSYKVDYNTRYFGESKTILLQPNERVLTLEFAALNYSQPSRNLFAYKLKGYNDDWVFANDHDITLMNLEAGTHTLHVKASNNDGVWSEETQLKIKVVPPFSKSIWFKIMIAAMLGLLAYLIYWNRKEQRRRLEKIRQRIATDLHDDMGSTLSSIRIFSDVAKKQVEEKTPETVPLLDRISNNATSLSENMQDIIWTIRSDNDTLEDLVSRMREFGLRVCDAKQIIFKVQVSQNFKTSKLNLEQRRNLYLIFKEVINNAVKYSECSEIDLFLTQKGRYLKMQITDNGKGFNVETVKRGNGLNNLEKRAKEINGTLRIESAAGEGTTIDLMIVLKKMALET